MPVAISEYKNKVHYEKKKKKTELAWKERENEVEVKSVWNKKRENTIYHFDKFDANLKANLKQHELGSGM